MQIGVETYGGGIWHSCTGSGNIMHHESNQLPGFDRDLGLAGRAMIRGEDGSIKATLVRIDRPSMYMQICDVYLDICFAIFC